MMLNIIPVALASMAVISRAASYKGTKEPYWQKCSGTPFCKKFAERDIIDDQIYVTEEYTQSGTTLRGSKCRLLTLIRKETLKCGIEHFLYSDKSELYADSQEVLLSLRLTNDGTKTNLKAELIDNISNERKNYHYVLDERDYYPNRLVMSNDDDEKMGLSLMDKDMFNYKNNRYALKEQNIQYTLGVEGDIRAIGPFTVTTSRGKHTGKFTNKILLRTITEGKRGYTQAKMASIFKTSDIEGMTDYEILADIGLIGGNVSYDESRSYAIDGGDKTIKFYICQYRNNGSLKNLIACHIINDTTEEIESKWVCREIVKDDFYFLRNIADEKQFLCVELGVKEPTGSRVNKLLHDAEVLEQVQLFNNKVELMQMYVDTVLFEKNKDVIKEIKTQAADMRAKIRQKIKAEKERKAERRWQQKEKREFMKFLRNGGTPDQDE